MTESKAGPLDGVRVLDLSRVLAGPWATQTLSDLGAEVIKIERPGSGDDTRRFGPPFLDRKDGGAGEAAYFVCANRGKRSVTVDISDPEGAALVRGLAGQCEVLVENFKVGDLARFGLDYAGLRAANPGLVYCSITGFGQTGPYAARAGYDYVIQGMGGLMSVTGEAGGEPVKGGVAAADLYAGLYASTAILAALLHARASGEGQHIDLGLFDVQTAILANQAINYLNTGEVPGRIGNTHASIVPYQTFAAADGALIVAVGNDAQFRALCGVLDAAQLGRDPRFAGNADRVANRGELTRRLQAMIGAMPLAHWLPRLEAAGVPSGPINSIDKVFAEPQALARSLVVEQVREDLSGPVRTVASPLRLSETPVAYRRPPPALGADTDEILRERLGLSETRLQALRERGVI